MPFHCEKHCNLLQILLGKPSVTYKFYFLASNKDMNEGAFLMIHNEFVNFFFKSFTFYDSDSGLFFFNFSKFYGVLQHQHFSAILKNEID